MSVNLDIGKYFRIFFIHQKEKPHIIVLKTREEMQATLENIRKIIAESLRSVFKKKKKS
jgi:hypothetical protein